MMYTMMPYLRPFGFPMFSEPVENPPRPIRSDLRETENGFLLEAEMPGFSKEDITLEIKDDVLTIAAGRNEEKEEEKRGYVFRERRVGKAERRFNVENINQSAITADFRNGILSVNLPRKVQHEPESYRIAIGDGE